MKQKLLEMVQVNVQKKFILKKGPVYLLTIGEFA